MDMRTRLNEEAVRFGKFGSLVGIVSYPPQEHSLRLTAIIFLNAGIVHRVGAGRTYVKLARNLASRGFITLRFDLSGIGDSPVRHDNLQFEKSAISEAQDAMDFLAEKRGTQDFILLGGCSGAKIAIETARKDERVVGTLLINFPSLDEDEDSAVNVPVNPGAFSYYRNCAIFNPSSWWRLLSGRANYTKLAAAMMSEAQRRMRQMSTREPTSFELNLKHLSDRKVNISFICSEGDHRLNDLRAAGGKGLKQLCAQNKVALEIIQRSDHTFSSLDDQEQLMSVLLARAETILATRQQSHALDRVAVPQHTSSLSSALLRT
jgi:pimeloyl-ACP methyl ester carboxylesterase